MAIKNKQELLDTLKAHLGDDTSDEAITLVEDISDTFTDLENRSADTTAWEKKYNDLDASWKKRYRDRFFKGEDDSTDDDDSDVDRHDPPPKTKSFEELFETGSK